MHREISSITRTIIIRIMPQISISTKLTQSIIQRYSSAIKMKSLLETFCRPRNSRGTRWTNSTELITKEFMKESCGRAARNFLTTFCPVTVRPLTSRYQWFSGKQSAIALSTPQLPSSDRPLKSRPSSFFWFFLSYAFSSTFPLSLSPSRSPRFLPPFRIQAFDSALNSFSKRRSTTLSKKKQEPEEKSDRGKKESRARATGLQTGMESKKLRNEERYFGCIRHKQLYRKKGTREKESTRQSKKENDVIRS